MQLWHPCYCPLICGATYIVFTCTVLGTNRGEQTERYLCKFNIEQITFNKSVLKVTSLKDDWTGHLSMKMKQLCIIAKLKMVVGGHHEEHDYMMLTSMVLCKTHVVLV